MGNRFPTDIELSCSIKVQNVLIDFRRESNRKFYILTLRKFSLLAQRNNIFVVMAPLQNILEYLLKPMGLGLSLFSVKDHLSAIVIVFPKDKEVLRPSSLVSA